MVYRYGRENYYPLDMGLLKRALVDTSAADEEELLRTISLSPVCYRPVAKHKEEIFNIVKKMSKVVNFVMCGQTGCYVEWKPIEN